MTPISQQCLTEAPKTRRQAELMQSSNLIEISPQPEGRVYTRCFCLEEPLGAVSNSIPLAALRDPSGTPPAAWPISPSAQDAPSPVGSMMLMGDGCLELPSHSQVASAPGKSSTSHFPPCQTLCEGWEGAGGRWGAREGMAPAAPPPLCTPRAA